MARARPVFSHIRACARHMSSSNGSNTNTIPLPSPTPDPSYTTR